MSKFLQNIAEMSAQALLTLAQLSACLSDTRMKVKNPERERDREGDPTLSSPRPHVYVYLK